MTAAYPRPRRAHLPAALAAVALLLAAGSLRAQTYDLDQGHYLTAEEYAKLSKDEAVAYCQKLAQEIDIQNDNAAATKTETADLDKEVAGLNAHLAEVKSASAQTTAEIAELESKLAEPAKPSKHVVVEGEWLYRIAGRPEVYGDRLQWKRIWEANRDRVPNPDLLYVGIELVIPR